MRAGGSIFITLIKLSQIFLIETWRSAERAVGTSHSAVLCSILVAAGSLDVAGFTYRAS